MLAAHAHEIPTSIRPATASRNSAFSSSVARRATTTREHTHAPALRSSSSPRDMTGSLLHACSTAQRPLRRRHTLLASPRRVEAEAFISTARYGLPRRFMMIELRVAMADITSSRKGLLKTPRSHILLFSAATRRRDLRLRILFTTDMPARSALAILPFISHAPLTAASMQRRARHFTPYTSRAAHYAFQYTLAAAAADATMTLITPVAK